MRTVLRGRHALPLLMAAVCIVLTGCNDLPTIVGTDTVPGTDTLYASSSLERPFFISDSSITRRTPFVNGAFFLFGNTATDQARVFVEFINYPDLGDGSTYDLVSADLMMIPQDYRYGDTTDKSLSLTAYELKKSWSANVTWDSIWSESGTTDFYATTDRPIAQFSTTITTGADTAVYVPLDTARIKQWLVKGRDSALVKEIYGMVLLSNATSSIRQYRNLEGVRQRMQMRVVRKMRDTTSKRDTTFVECAVANFISTAAPGPGEVVVQGGHIRQARLTCSLDSIPANAIILGGTLRVTVNAERSRIGSFGRDEILNLNYVPATGPVINLASRGNANGEFVFENLGPFLQLLRKNGGRGDLFIQPTGVYESWRMNRLHLYTLADDLFKRPRLTVAYTIPGVFTK